MYFETYEEALQAAIKQSKGKLMDTTLYVKFVPPFYAVDPFNPHYTGQYKIGFTPDHTYDTYIYNGEVFKYMDDPC